EETRVALDGGLGIVASSHTAPVAAGEQVLVMVRPESLSLTPDAGSSGGNRIRGTVERIEFIGGISRVRLRLADGAQVSVKLLSGDGPLATLTVGAAVEAAWSP